ncbi:MAG: aminoglycoside phosphotransferase family protein, partial [Burkholderiaceae bacterium]|nr:aminoglycoside phosphotransferase family protein [Burkholderiaceae bacterium]
MNHAVPRDPALPQLATALNGQAMAEVFASQLRSHGQLKVQGCAVNRVKYRPRRNCSVSYTLALRDQGSGRAFEQRVAARFCVDGDSARRHAKLSGRVSHPSAAGPTLTHLASLDLVLQWAPNDPRLAAVAELYDDTRLRSCWLPEVVAAMTCGQGRLLDHRTSLVQYVPEHRVCARIDMQLQEAPGAPTVTRTVYAKADAEQRGPITHKVMQALSGSAAQLTGKLRTPRSILWQAQPRLHWQEGVVGRTVLELSPHLDPRLAARIGALVAALHATPVSTPRVDTVAEFEHRPRQVAAILGLVEPGWQPLLGRLVSALEAGAHKLASLPVVTLHGDLHPHNILLDGRHLTLIDLDS